MEMHKSWNVHFLTALHIMSYSLGKASKPGGFISYVACGLSADNRKPQFFMTYSDSFYSTSKN